MPAPSNISFATATDVGSLPASISQDVRFGGVNYTVFYKFTAARTEVVGVYAKGDPFTTTVPTGYRPRLIVYDQDVSILTPPYLSLDATNIPLQMPVTAGASYWFRISSPAGNTPTTAVLNLNVLSAPASIAPVGSIAINDDNPGFPMAILSATDASVLRFVQPFPAGEQGIVLPSGTMLVEDTDTSVVPLYSSAFVPLAQPAITFYGNIVISSNQDDTWYVGDSGSASGGGHPSIVRTVDSAGTVGATTWTLGSGAGLVGLTAMAPNLAGTILYYNDATGSSSVVKKWDLVGNVSAGTFTASLAGYLVHDILNVADGTFLISYQKNSATKNLKVLRYNAAAVVQNTYDFGANIASFDQRMCMGIDDLSFWMFQNQTGADTGISRFIRTRISDGVVLASLPHVTYEGGMYGAAETEFPDRFGQANSCPIMLLRALAASPTTYTTTRHPIRWLRRFPLGTNENKRLFIQRLEIILQQGLGTATGQGSDPQMMCRFSKDGGKTWGAERLMGTGKQGDYEHQTFLNLLGFARAPVAELSGTDPAPMYLCKALADIESGSN